MRKIIKLIATDETKDNFNKLIHVYKVMQLTFQEKKTCIELEKHT